MISKIRTGASFFDDACGGAYRGRAMLVSGAAGSGKSVFGLQFIAQGIAAGERCLLLSVRPAADVAIYADALELPIGPAIDSGSAIILEYNDYVPGPNAEAQLQLPPDGFVQLQDMITANGIQRVVLDTCLPWVCLPALEQLAQHVFSFVRSFDRLGVTTLLTLPKPVSPAAYKLKSILEDIVPAAVTLSIDGDTRNRCWTVVKYLGEARPDQGTAIEIVKGVGLRAVSDAAS